MKENKYTITIDDETQYKRLNIKWYGNGIFLRDEIKGKKIKTKKQTLVKTNQFVVAEIDAKNGSFGVVPKSLVGAIVSSHYFVFDLDLEQIIPEYFDYMIRFAPYTEMIQRHVKGTTNYSAIRPNHILGLNLPLPPIEIQQIIVARLNNQTNIIKNAENTINAVKEGITDISDFEGDYEYKEIRDACKDILTGGTPSRKKPEYFKGDIPWLKISDLHRLDYTSKSEEKITKTGLDSSNAKLLSKDTVLFTIFATIADVSLLGMNKACTNQAIVGLVPKDGIDPKFLMYCLYTLKSYFKAKSRGVTQDNINLGILISTKVPIPPLDKQKELVKQMDERKSILEELEKTKINARNIIQNIINNLFKSE